MFVQPDVGMLTTGCVLGAVPVPTMTLFMNVTPCTVTPEFVK